MKTKPTPHDHDRFDRPARPQHPSRNRRRPCRLTVAELDRLAILTAVATAAIVAFAAAVTFHVVNP